MWRVFSLLRALGVLLSAWGLVEDFSAWRLLLFLANVGVLLGALVQLRREATVGGDD